MARGVIAALEAQGLASADSVFVAGSDADLTNIQYVAQGRQAVEIWKQIDPLAQTAAEVAFALASDPDTSAVEILDEDKVINNGFADVPTIVTPITLVTKANIDDTIIAGGFYTNEEVHGN
jgi:D-xylose transport system substrate-binding protein